MTLRMRRGGASPPVPGGVDPVYTFPTTPFTFPTFPDDGGVESAVGVINVMDYGAVGDGIADDTNAIQAAMFATRDLSTHQCMKKTVYFPGTPASPKTYRLTGLSGNTRGIIQRRDNGQTSDTRWKGGMRLQGQSEAGVILRLDDNAPDFQNAADPRFVIYQSNYGIFPPGGEFQAPPTNNHWIEDGIGLTAFYNFIRDITIDLGEDNPGAVGINIQMHNIGSIRRVTVQDALGAGRTSDATTRARAGFVYDRQGVGPCHLHRLTAKGMQYGVRLELAIYGQGIEHLRVQNQGVAGVLADTQAVFIRGMESSNTVPAIIAKHGDSYHHFGEPTAVDGGPWVHDMTGVTQYDNTHPHLLLVDAVLTGTGGASGISAVQMQSAGGEMFLRNIQAPGYARVAQTTSGNISGQTITEHATDSHNLWGETPSSLNILIKDTPTRPWPVVGNMTSATALGMTMAGAQQNAALQTAIDNCPTDTLYFPSTKGGLIRLGTGTIVIRGNVRHIVGNGVFIETVSGTTLTWTFGGAATGAPYFIEDVLFRHNSGNTISWQVPADRDVVFQDIGNLGQIRNSATGAGTGTVYYDSVSGNTINLDFAKDVYGRDVNPDGGNYIVKYVGGNCWIFYYKHERGTRHWSGVTGGNIEMMGGFPTLVDDPSPSTPIWQFANANVSIEGTVYADVWGGGLWATLVQETQGATTRHFLRTGNTFTTDPPVRGANVGGDGRHIALFRSKAV